jgi:hypothetical protein
MPLSEEHYSLRLTRRGRCEADNHFFQKGKLHLLLLHQESGKMRFALYMREGLLGERLGKF